MEVVLTLATGLKTMELTFTFGAVTLLISLRTNRSAFAYMSSQTVGTENISPPPKFYYVQGRKLQCTFLCSDMYGK